MMTINLAETCSYWFSSKYVLSWWIFCYFYLPGVHYCNYLR